MNEITSVRSQMRPLFPLKRGSAVGMITVADYRTAQQSAEAKLITALKDHGIGLSHEVYFPSFGETERDKLHNYLGESLNRGVSTFFMTGGYYNECVLRAFQEASLYSLYAEAKPIAFVLPEEALSRMIPIQKCRDKYTDHLGSLHFGSEYSVDHGSPSRFGDFDPRQGPQLSVAVFSGMGFLESRVLDPQQSESVPPLYLSGEVPDLFGGSNIPTSEKQGILKDVVRAVEERTWLFPPVLGFISFIADMANEGLIDSKAQADDVRQKLFDILGLPPWYRGWGDIPLFLGQVKDHIPEYGILEDHIDDYQGLCKYLDWLRKYFPLFLK